MHSLRIRFLKLTAIAACVVAIAAVPPIALAQKTVRSTRNAATPRNQTAAQAPPVVRYTGAWEPVNYPDDVRLTEAYFVSPEEGWVIGQGYSTAAGFILHTRDGGAHWEVQAGDPQSNTPELYGLHFLDQRHGWVVQKGPRLLRTSDGSHWEEAGEMPKFVPYHDYAFTSLSNGVFIGGYDTEGTKVFVTHDGGRNWKQVFVCATKLQVQGLTRNTGCNFSKLHFSSPNVGYAVGGGNGFAVVARTDDGGDTWRFVFVSTEMPQLRHVFFTDDNTGLATSANSERKIYYTNDGGKNWRGVIGNAEQVRFADPQTGWSCYVRTCSFTTDGGQSWNAREYPFPGAYVNGFSVPRRDRAYVVGEHGMVYRYRIIPADRLTKDMIPAPLLPGYGGELDARLERMRDEVRDLGTKLGVSLPSASAGNAAPAQSPAPAPAAGGFQNQIADDSAAPAAPSSQAPGEGGFSQTAAGADAAGGAFAGGDAAAGGFAQDTNFANIPASAEMQQCCATQLQSFQADLGSFSQQVPGFSGKFKNLNLLYVGLNMFSDLVKRTDGIKQAFLALKKAPNSQSAAAALQQLSASLEGTSQEITTGFQSLALNNVSTAGSTFSNTATDAGSAMQPMTQPQASSPSQPAQANDAGNQQQKKTESLGDQIKKKAKARWGISIPH